MSLTATRPARCAALVEDSASWPWPNRLEDGAYEFEGRHQLPINEVQTQTAIHGLVRWSAWTASEQTQDRVVMRHRLRPQPGYPFSLSLSIAYSLGEEGLTVRTTATNAGLTRRPFGSGAHPYLAAGAGKVDPLMLSVPASGWLRANSRGLPVAQESVASTEYDFREPRPIGATRFDHALFDLDRGNDGRARVRLRDPATGEGVTVWMDETYAWIMVFTGGDLPDVSRRSLAVEPMTYPPNAFRSGEGVIVLEPGRSVTCEWGISPRC